MNVEAVFAKMSATVSPTYADAAFLTLPPVQRTVLADAVGVAPRTATGSYRVGRAYAREVTIAVRVVSGHAPRATTRLHSAPMGT